MHSVLFVCTANICRSPMAMGLLYARVAKREDPWKVESAGTWAIPGQPAASNTRKILLESKIDIGEHRSRSVTRELLYDFNLILVMEQGQKEALRAEFPEIASRVYLFSEMVAENFDLEDPIGGPLEAYRITAQTVERILNDGFDKISRLSADQA